MRAGAALAAIAFALGGCAPEAPEGAGGADVSREAPADPDVEAAQPQAIDAFKPVPDTLAEQVDFDADGTPESVSVVTFAGGDTKGVHFDDPWLRSTGGKPATPRPGDRLLLIRGGKIGVWALSNAAHEAQRALHPGGVPIEFQDCWNEPKGGAVFTGGEGGGGVIAWKADKFEWIQCGD